MRYSIKTLKNYYQKSNSEIEQETIIAEVIEASQIRNHLFKKFETIIKNYQVFCKKKISSTKRYIDFAIDSTNSGSELKQTLNGRISRTMSEVQIEFEQYIKKTMENISLEQKQFIHSYFHDFYKTQRLNWLINLYHNPVIILSILSILAIFTIRNYPEIPYQFLFTIASTYWIVWIPIGVIIFYVLIKLWFLNSNQLFIPPKLSLASINTDIMEQANDINGDKSEMVVGTSSLGIISGALLGGPLGAFVGGVIGSGLGWAMGDDLADMKQRAKNRVLQEFEYGIHQLDDQFSNWLEQYRDKMLESATSSLNTNFNHVQTMLKDNPNLTKKLISKSQLMLEAQKK